MIILEEITKEQLKKDTMFLFIHSPFCGTCHLARKILEQIETNHNKQLFYEMNASLYPEFMQTHKIESVPCLYIKVGHEVKEKIYAFQSTGNIYRYILLHAPSLLQ
ncbi:thioredoxin family protein [Virgibacillus sp. W0181]|uniref:thioredoxin family protein n=1 Tax=Virgibacillus sp. W0181 TaxID=3391581 RepID=UPI003F48D995